MKRSTNKYDVAKWIEKVLDSCTTSAQVRSAQKLFRYFDRLHTDTDDWLLVQRIRIVANDTWSDLFAKELTKEN